MKDIPRCATCRWWQYKDRESQARGLCYSPDWIIAPVAEGPTGEHLPWDESFQDMAELDPERAKAVLDALGDKGAFQPETERDFVCAHYQSSQKAGLDKTLDLPRLLYTIEEASELLRVNRLTLDKWRKEGKLRMTEIAQRRWFVPRTEIQRLIEEATTDG